MPIEDLQLAAQKIAGFLSSLNKLGGMRLKYRIAAGDPQDHEGGALQVELSGPDTALLTAHNGELLMALETVAAQILRLDQREHDLVSFDAGDFKALRAQELKMQAETAAEKVLKTGVPFAFPPTNSRERRLLHMVFKTIEGVETASRLTELANTLQQSQTALKTEMLSQTLEKLAEATRADRELLQDGLRKAALQQAETTETLTRTLNERLDAITGVVGQRLDEGFKKTNETFASVMTRLALIDEAQKKIGELTVNVVSLQELLGDKKARGAFGEVQLEALVENALPPDAETAVIAGHLVEFLKREVAAGRLTNELLPIQAGIGTIADALELDFTDIAQIGGDLRFTATLRQKEN